MSSSQMAHNAINKLLEEGVVEKLGRSPKTVYRNKSKSPDNNNAGILLASITETQADFLDKNFLVVTETGTLLNGIAAFDYWCKQRKLPTLKTLDEFEITKKKYAPYYNQGWLYQWNG